jgi:diguanylate cyclase (GGDEF)-like protein
MASPPLGADPAGASAGGPAPELALVRLRLGLVIAAAALAGFLAGVALAVVEGTDTVARLGAALGGLPLPALPLILAIWGSIVVLTAVLAGRVTEPARQLDATRRSLHRLYETARDDALRDSLTGLGNHRAFQETCGALVEAAAATATPVTLALLDLDEFKVVNDTAGHAAGDDLLVAFARLLEGSLRRSDRAFRIGGDEFAVLLVGTRREEASVALRRLLAQCLEPAGPRRGFSFSAGLSEAPGLARTRDELFAQADEALYEAKRAGRTTVVVHEPTRRREGMDEGTLRRAVPILVEVLRRRAVDPVYQPIVDLRTGDVRGYEGLIRPRPTAESEGPGLLVAAAEASGRTFDFDRMCIETIVAGAAEAPAGTFLSLNLSPRSVEAPEFSPAWLARLLAEHGWSPARVVLEITERQAVEDPERLAQRLAACRSHGFRIAIDDVGAGNAGLRLLSQIHFDVVKIDISLVQAGARQESALAVLRSLVDLAARWGAEAVAEGLETPSQLQMVRDLGLREGQGYLLARPLPRPDLARVDIAALAGLSDLRALLLGVGS